jgi:hypothetical protein
MWKYLSILLAGLLVVSGIFYIVERSSNKKVRRELNNEIAKLEGVVKETETAYSRRALEVRDLEIKNKDLSVKIKDRDEKITALGEAVLKWKGKYFKIKGTQSVVDSDGNETSLDLECRECLIGKRFIVGFDETKDHWRVWGNTITNPPEAEINISWASGLRLSFILTRNEDDTFRLYLDSDSPDLVPAELELAIDPSVFEKKWYEKIGVGLDIGVGEGVYSAVQLHYDIFDDLFVGPKLIWTYDGNKLRKLYGATFGWYPFR